MNAENVDQVFSEPPTVEERLARLETIILGDGCPFIGDEVYYYATIDKWLLQKAEARIAELEAELALEKAKNKQFNGCSGISPIKLEPLAIYPL